ncbi:MAG TPA: amidohydrolase family protein [Tepidisphaeraceae bacterium]|nr:amidohydrolase family protein [Tepidisphaeraceae bacterium]
MTSDVSGLREEDHEFYERELAKFIPDRIFDAHTHLWEASLGSWPIESQFTTIGHEEYVQLMGELHPNRVKGVFFLPVFETSELVGPGNEWVARHVKASGSFRGAFFVRPTDDPEWVRQEVRRLGLHGLKCYHTFASSQPTWEAEIPDYLPESIMRVANEEGWPITLHMVKSTAVADPGNLYWIRRYCEAYPNAKLILAHSARGFQPAHNFAGLPMLKGLDNLYFDTSANCEPLAHETIIRIIGHKKLLYGTDLPVCHMRGRSVGVGNSFIWLDAQSPVWNDKHLRVRPVLVGLEHLRSLKWACWSAGISDEAIEDIFWNNAAELFGVSKVQ